MASSKVSGVRFQSTCVRDGPATSQDLRRVAAGNGSGEVSPTVQGFWKHCHRRVSAGSSQAVEFIRYLYVAALNPTLADYAWSITPWTREATASGCILADLLAVELLLVSQKTCGSLFFSGFVRRWSSRHLFQAG